MTFIYFLRQSGKPLGYWLVQENRRSFFLQFAKDKNFDPYVTENWAGVTLADLCEGGGVYVTFLVSPK